MTKSSIINQITLITMVPLIKHWCFYIFRTGILGWIFCFDRSFSSFDSLISVYGDIYIIWSMHILQLYLSYESIFSRNYMKFYISALIMIRNAILTFSIIYVGYYGYSQLNVILGTLFSLALLIEALLTIDFVKKNKLSSWLENYKKLGPNKKINDAYINRSMLHTFIPLKFFYIVGILLRCTDLTYNIQRWFYLLFFVSFIVSVLQYFFIFLGFYDEDWQQRKIALALTIIDLCLTIFLISIDFIFYDKLVTKNKGVEVIFHLNNLFTSFLISYFLIKDTLTFDSGLVSVMNNNKLEKRINLS